MEEFKKFVRGHKQLSREVVHLVHTGVHLVHLFHDLYLYKVEGDQHQSTDQHSGLYHLTWLQLLES